MNTNYAYYFKSKYFNFSEFCITDLKNIHSKEAR